MTTYKLSIADILNKIKQEETFEAIALDGSFRIKVLDYVPYICAAIHDGHNLRPELESNCLLSENERWFEEDPITGDFIASMPIVLTGQDSRYEYDLNRSPEKAIYKEAWGKEVWKAPLSDKEKAISLEKHAGFYKIVDALVAKLEQKFKACLVFDMHSYNHRRMVLDPPLFNIGAERVDRVRFNSYIKHWRRELSKIQLPNITNVSKVNAVFYGMGYFLEHITTNHKNTLVLATEIKKIFYDEDSGEQYPQVIEGLKESLRLAILNHAFYFIKRETNFNPKKKSDLLSSDLERSLIEVDQQLYALVRNFEILNFINPINIEQEKRRFFRNNFKENPNFKYKNLIINTFGMKRLLTDIPVEKIRDVKIRMMYEDVINAYLDKVDILSSIGTQKFLYNSLRYFGEPDEKDIANANFLLFCPPLPEDEEETLDEKAALSYFKKTVATYGFDCKMGISDKIVSKALVINSKKTVLIKKGARFTENSLKALAHHEIGVHMVTTLNSQLQPIRIFNLGLPLNTLTQEGLAVLSEYQSGNITLKRLQELGLRVLAIRSMLRHREFRETFLMLTEEHGMDPNKAYYLTTRVYRGGGFTKDFLYLRGLKDILHHYHSGKSLEPLLIGKTSLIYYDVIVEMIDRKLIEGPKFITEGFKTNAVQTGHLDYLISGIK